MSETIIFGYGTIGRAVTKLLLKRGGTVRVAQCTIAELDATDSGRNRLRH